MGRPRHGNVRMKSLETVDRALRVLKELGRFPEGATVKDLTAATGINRTTVLRILVTLEANGLVTWNAERGRYELGLGTLELASMFLATHDLGRVVRPQLEALRDLTGETASLYVRDGQHRVCLYRVESLQPVRITVAIGQRLPLYRGAAGKVLLAGLPDEQTEAMLVAAPLTDEDRRALRQELRHVRATGVAKSFGERQPEIASVAVAVRRGSGDVVAAVAVSGPINRWTTARMDASLPSIQAVAATLGRHLL